MGFEAEPEVHLLNAELDEAHRDPEVCDAMHELGVDYALDFGPRELHGRSATYTGLNEISETGAAEVVLQRSEERRVGKEGRAGWWGGGEQERRDYVRNGTAKT